MFKNLIISILLSSVVSATPNYVGDKSCMACHKLETNEWKHSQHAEAMMVADENSVKGDFNNATFNYNGIISTFYKKNGKYMVKTDGPDGKLHDYEITYTFGIYPLQQYMIKFPNGKVQVLDPTWDNRAKEDGGQRWYHIRKDENVIAGDPVHWTGPNMNWNYMCADCHSTNLKKNYDEKTKAYLTTYDSINVSCESCHGPASEHIKWTTNQTSTLQNKGFPLSFKNSKQKPWREQDSTLRKALQTQELNVCAKCHSRRTQLDDEFVAGDNFHDHYLPVNLDEGLYFSDGKIQDEVYVYNSFIQSKMFEEGVTCSDCHNPHTLERKGSGDKVCAQCHQPNVYEAPAHHKHKKGAKGSSCIDCHMPARTYMGIDSRNDHSFRVPRPDLSVNNKELPNACNLCHKDKSPEWASDVMKKWYGEIPKGAQNFSHALESLRSNSADAPKTLYSVLMGDSPKIAKATVTQYLGNYPNKQTYMTTLQMLRNSDPMIRRSALQALEAFPVKLRVKETFKILKDPVKIVRIEAARQLASFPLGQLDEERKAILTKAINEYEKTLLFSADRPEAQLSLALFYTQKKMFKKAEKAYKEAINLQVMFVPAYINYSDFLLQSGKEEESFAILQRGLKEVPNIAILHHSLGLSYIRSKEYVKANEKLKKAVELDPTNARFSYVYAVSLGEGKPQEAISILEKAYEENTGNMEIVSGLIYYSKKVGNAKKTTQYENILKSLQNFSIQNF